MRTAAAVLTTLAISFAARPAHACSLATNGTHTVDPEHVADAIPPGSVNVVDVAVERYADDSTGCMAGCGSRGVITLDLDTEDDRTTPDRMGYLIEVVGGDAPPSLTFDTEAVTSFGGPLYFHFDFEEPRFEIELEIRAVDLNGNIGPATTLFIGEPPADGGCSTTGRHGALASLGLAGLALAVALRRRRR